MISAKGINATQVDYEMRPLHETKKEDRFTVPQPLLRPLDMQWPGCGNEPDPAVFGHRFILVWIDFYAAVGQLKHKA